MAARILLVEDSADDARLIVDTLNEAGVECVYERVETAEAMRAALQDRTWDLVLCDYMMPRLNALGALEVLHASGLDLPFIIVSGTVGEETAVAAMRAGAHDYVMKNRLTRLAAAVERELRDVSVREDRRALEAKLHEEEARFRALVEKSSDGIMVIDPQGLITYGSPSTERILGYRPEDFLGHDVFDFVHPDDVSQVRQAFVAIHDQPGGLDRRELRIRPKSGGWRWIEIQATNVQHLPSVAGLIINYRDITERLQAEIALREEREMFDRLASTIPDRIYFKDRQSRFVRVNEAMIRFFGLDRTIAVIGRTDFDFFTADHAGQAFGDEQRIIETGESVVGIEEKETWPDGRITWASTTKIPWLDPAGKIVGVIGVSRDVTARKKDEDAFHESEQRLQFALDASHAGSWSWDAVTNVSIWDDRFRVLYDLAPGTPCAFAAWIERVHSEDRPRLLARLEQMRSTPGDDRWEESYRSVSHEGQVRWHLGIGQAQRDDQNNLVRMAGIDLDITARKADEQRLREQATLLDRTNEAIIASDLIKRITFWNRGAERLFGRTAAEAVGRSFDDFLAKAGVQGEGQIRAMLALERDWRGEFRGVTRRGETSVVEASVTVLRDESGQPTGRIAICTDVTAKKELEAQFLRAQRLESVGMLAAGIAHDLNNILAPISMAAPLLRLGTSRPSDLRILDTLERCAERGAGLVRQILGFVHGISGEPRLVQVKHLLRDVANVITETFPKSITLDEDIPSELWPIMANPTQIHQVLLNLCVNARDAMPKGGALRLRAENRVLDEAAAQTIERARPGAWLLLQIEDSGTGIPPEIATRIWEPFFTTKSADKGTGLGLSTVRGIVTSHQGFIEMETQVGHGTTFRIYLPAAETTLVPPAESRPPAAPASHGESILLVDDEETIRDTAGAILRRAGYQVHTAEDGLGGRDTFEKLAADLSLVITDIDMPNMSGDALAAVVHARRPDLPIIAMSGLRDQFSPVATESFATAFLLKPFSAETLVQKTHELLHPETDSKAEVHRV